MAAGLDTVRAGRFDNGRMFTLDDPPLPYFAETYNFRPDGAWFERARLGALRFATYCSASFVSPDGLILTNHHCARAVGDAGRRRARPGLQPRRLLRREPRAARRPSRTSSSSS